MKNKKVVLICLCLASFDIFPQANNTVVMANEQMNVLYTGYYNEITVASLENFDSLSAEGNANIEIVSKGDKSGNYRIQPFQPGEISLSIFSNGKRIGNKNFRVKVIPRPQLKINGHYNPSSITKYELKTIGYLGAGAPGFDLDYNFKVISYEVMITTREQGKVMVFQCVGNRINEEVLQALSSNEIEKVYIEARVSNSSNAVFSIDAKLKVEG